MIKIYFSDFCIIALFFPYNIFEYKYSVVKKFNDLIREKKIVTQEQKY